MGAESLGLWPSQVSLEYLPSAQFCSLLPPSGLADGHRFDAGQRWTKYKSCLSLKGRGLKCLERTRREKPPPLRSPCRQTCHKICREAEAWGRDMLWGGGTESLRCCCCCCCCRGRAWSHRSVRGVGCRGHVGGKALCLARLPFLSPLGFEGFYFVPLLFLSALPVPGGSQRLWPEDVWAV